MKKCPLDKICFALEKYKSKYMLDPEKWHFTLRWIEMPWSDVQTAFKCRGWHFTLRPALESGWITSEQLKILEHCHRDEDLPEALLKLSLHGVNPMILFEEANEHITKIEDLTTGEMLFKAESGKVQLERCCSKRRGTEHESQA